MQGILGQLEQSMSQGVPEPGQVDSASPNFAPSMQPPPVSPMPQKSPASMMHKTAIGRHFQKQGLPVPPQVEQMGQPITHYAQPSNLDLPQHGMPGAMGGAIGASNPTPSEPELIIKALDSRMKHHSKITEKFVDTLLSLMGPQGGQNNAAAGTAINA